MNSNKLKLTPALVPLGKGYPEKSDIMKRISHDDPEDTYGEIIGELEVCLTPERCFPDTWQAQQLLLLSDREIKGGDWYFWMVDKTIEKRDPNGIAKLRNCQRIEAAYPTIEGLPPISQEFMQMYCENPDGEIWMEMNHKLKCEICGSVQYLQYSMCQCMECDCDACDCFNLEISEEPRLESGFIALEIAGKETILTNIVRQMHEMKRSGTMPPPTFALQGQPKLADAHIASTSNIANNLDELDGKLDDVRGEVMSARDWFNKKYPVSDEGDISFWPTPMQVEEYAKYYHTTLSRQPEQKAEGMSAEEWLDQADDEYQYGSTTHIAKGYAAYFHAAQLAKEKTGGLVTKSMLWDAYAAGSVSTWDKWTHGMAEFEKYLTENNITFNDTQSKPVDPVGVDGPTEIPTPKPIGDFILSQKDILPVMTSDGAYYYYGDVCTLLNRLQAAQVDWEKVESELYKKPFTKNGSTLDVNTVTTVIDFLRSFLSGVGESEAVKLSDILKKIDEVSDMYPYKVAGNHDTYSTYNEAWDDCCGIIEERIKELLPTK